MCNREYYLQGVKYGNNLVKVTLDALFGNQLKCCEILVSGDSCRCIENIIAVPIKILTEEFNNFVVIQLPTLQKYIVNIKTIKNDTRPN